MERPELVAAEIRAFLGWVQASGQDNATEMIVSETPARQAHG
jgi:hypothetical protein